ncbi:hypothetical protein DSM104299_03162 [Baekduia alba]|uniref:hypothetical protein n=1 Tax=Baekduia alba TaxID=2997333 RepID=UPI0023411DAE|nr:hypothetical protein [Baekduia alba]WCB94426.1 hypothetical protein DSM104299_03162 [Baekduia alba]
MTAYEISVLGRVDAALLADLEQLEAVRQPTVTVLRGTLSDPGELRTVLARLQDRGLELVEIRQLDADDGDPE